MNFKSHLNTVVIAINTFTPLREVIIKQFRDEITDEIVAEVEKYGQFIIDVTITKELLAGALMIAESSDEGKKKLLYIVDKFMGNDKIENIIQSLITDKKSAEKVALALSFIGMYADYLDGKEWNGPKLSSERFESRLKVREIFNIQDNNFTETYIKLNESKDMRNNLNLLDKLDKSDLANDLLVAYKIIKDTQEELKLLHEHIEQLDLEKVTKDE